MILGHHPTVAEGLDEALEVLTAWSWDPTALVAVGVMAGLYTAGLLRSRGRRAGLLPWWRPVCFYAGELVLLLALASPIDTLSDHLFFMHMIQHILMTMLAAPLILLGAPIVPILRGLPRPFRRRALVPVARSAAVRGLLRTLTTPRTSFLFYVGIIWVWHVPFLYNLALENAAIHLVEHMLFFVSALLFWGAVIDPIPFPPRLGYPVRMLYLFGAATPNAALGAFLAYSPAPWYDFYIQGIRFWSFTAMEDQHVAGLIMWLPSWMMFLLAICIIFFIMMGEEERSLRARMARAGERPG